MQQFHLIFFWCDLRKWLSLNGYYKEIYRKQKKSCESEKYLFLGSDEELLADIQF